MMTNLLLNFLSKALLCIKCANFEQDRVLFLCLPNGKMLQFSQSKLR
jgi:hypothetical protein